MLKKYKSHKIVEAMKINKIESGKRWYLSSVPEDGTKISVKSDYMAKHKPEVGGYYVKYADGYESFSPAEAFESGYTEVEPDSAQHEELNMAERIESAARSYSKAISDSKSVPAPNETYIEQQLRMEALQFATKTVGDHTNTEGLLEAAEKIYQFIKK